MSPPAPREFKWKGRRTTETGAGRGRGNSTARKTAGPTAPRMIAIRVVERVQRAGAYADLALHHALVQSRIPAADRALATELVYGTLRWRGRLDYLISKALDRDISKLEPLVTSALRVGAYQLFFSDRIPANAAVDEAVRCVRAMGLERATGLVNAVLRRLARDGDSIEFPKLETDPLDYLVHACSLPRWLAERWLNEFGAEEAAELAATMNEPAPVTLRVNRTKTTREALLPELIQRFPDATLCRYAPDGIILGRKGDAGQDPTFLSGQISVQDEASQLVVRPSRSTTRGTDSRHVCRAGHEVGGHRRTVERRGTCTRPRSPSPAAPARRPRNSPARDRRRRHPRTRRHQVARLISAQDPARTLRSNPRRRPLFGPRLATP